MMRIHTWWDNADLLVVNPVQHFQLGTLRCSRGNDPIGSLHHAGFALNSVRALPLFW